MDEPFPTVRTEFLLAADEFLDGEFWVLHGEGSQRQESVGVPPHRAPQVVVNQLRQVESVRAFRLRDKKTELNVESSRQFQLHFQCDRTPIYFFF